VLFSNAFKDNFDKIVKELAYEARAKATDRLKTQEELIKEEKEKLEKMEVFWLLLKIKLTLFFIRKNVLSVCAERKWKIRNRRKQRRKLSRQMI
jgi:hypothetical protein